jgi:hypothetical protein
LMLVNEAARLEPGGFRHHCAGVLAFLMNSAALSCSCFSELSLA